MPKKNIFAFGCSFTKDNHQQTWADLVAAEFNLTLNNCAERGAGSEFIVSRLLTEHITNQDIVAIMWPSADRYDLWADHTVPHLLEDCKYASWPDGKSPQFVDYYGNYRTDQGFNLNGSVPRGYKHKFYKYFYTPHQTVHNWYINIINAQLYLESCGIKYVMCSAFPLRYPIHYHTGDFKILPEIYNKIKLNTFVDHSEHSGFFNFCLENNYPFLNQHHPASESHCKYVNDVLKLKIQKLLDK
jgi:hypothetical protein